MSTVQNEDPQESANRLVPKSLADGLSGSVQSVTMATGSRSCDSLQSDGYQDRLHIGEFSLTRNRDIRKKMQNNQFYEIFFRFVKNILKSV